MAAIEMKNIVKKYGDGFPAVNDVTIDVERAGLPASVLDRVLRAAGPTITASSSGSRSAPTGSATTSTTTARSAGSTARCRATGSRCAGSLPTTTRSSASSAGARRSRARLSRIRSAGIEGPTHETSISPVAGPPPRRGVRDRERAAPVGPRGDDALAAAPVLLLADAKRQGPPTDAEVSTLSARYWREAGALGLDYASELMALGTRSAARIISDATTAGAGARVRRAGPELSALEKRTDVRRQHGPVDAAVVGEQPASVGERRRGALVLASSGAGLRLELVVQSRFGERGAERAS